MKLYTKTGDKGQTSLYGGKRVSKASARVEAYGNIDELNSAIGVALSFIDNEALNAQLKKIQYDLFTLGAEVATPTDKLFLANGKPRLPITISEKEINELENWIDELDAQLEPLQHFILPSGGKASAHLHLARTICRRTERSVIFLNENEELRSEIIIYLNRLSDYLFVASRFSAKMNGEKENYWTPRD